MEALTGLDTTAPATAAVIPVKFKNIRLLLPVCQAFSMDEKLMRS
jgi:hypothetical protein